MPELPAPIPLGRPAPGGILGYPLDQLHEEVAFIAYYLHWPQEQIMAMEHADRRAWVERVSALNRRVAGEEG
jgi:hypothetical protein